MWLPLSFSLVKGQSRKQEADSPAGQTTNTGERLGCDSLVEKAGWVCSLWKNSLQRWDPCPDPVGEGVGMDSTEGPGHGGPATNTWLGTSSLGDS